MSTESKEAYTALVAFDWADQKHAGALQAGKGPVEAFELDQTPEASTPGLWRCEREWEGRWRSPWSKPKER